MGCMTISAKLLMLVPLIAACTEKNPSKCSDGVCIDPDRPYCDSDGLVAGKPDTCIAADCMPGALAACRGDVAISCNADATNYVEVQCPLGCDPSANGCRQCTNNAQCEGLTPICDTTTSSCRTCTTDDECDSKVCDFGTGACVPEASVVYATPQSLFGTCSKTQPCSLPTAVTAALNSAGNSVLRMLPGIYDVPLDVATPTSKALQIVATGATVAVVGDTPAIRVVDGASVRVRGLASASERHVICGRSTTAMASLALDLADFTSVGGLTRLEITRCRFEVRRSRFVLNGPSALLDDANIDMDRVHLSGNAVNNLNLINSSRIKLLITNSLLENVFINSVFPQDTSAPGTTITLSYDTLVMRSPLRTCSGSTVPFRTVTFENSIVAAVGNFDAVEDANQANCTFTSTIAFPQTTSAPLNAITQDPKFANPAGADFHLQSTSPAIDRATAANVLPTPDLEGHARPIGVAPDLGAYERP